MPIAGVNIYRGDITRPIEIGVRTDSGVVRLRYSPAGETLPVQRWSVRTGCST
jgi:hypothetical protein